MARIDLAPSAPRTARSCSARSCGARSSACVASCAGSPPAAELQFPGGSPRKHASSLPAWPRSPCGSSPRRWWDPSRPVARLSRRTLCRACQSPSSDANRSVEAEARERLDQLALLVAEVREQGVAEEVHRPRCARSIPSGSPPTSASIARSTRSSRSAITSCSSSRRSMTGARSASRVRRCGKTDSVLERVVAGHDAAVGGAEGAERPAVLADRHAVDERAHGGGVAVAGGDLRDQVAQPGELRAQAVVDVDRCWPAACWSGV